MKLNKRTLEIIKRKVLAYLLITVMIAGVVTPLSYASANQASDDLVVEKTDNMDTMTGDDGIENVLGEGDSLSDLEDTVQEEFEQNGDTDNQTEEDAQLAENMQNDDLEQTSLASDSDEIKIEEEETEESDKSSDEIKSYWESYDWNSFDKDIDWNSIDENTYKLILDVLGEKANNNSDEAEYYIDLMGQVALLWPGNDNQLSDEEIRLDWETQISAYNASSTPVSFPEGAKPTIGLFYANGGSKGDKVQTGDNVTGKDLYLDFQWPVDKKISAIGLSIDQPYILELSDLKIPSGLGAAQDAPFYYDGGDGDVLFATIRLDPNPGPAGSATIRFHDLDVEDANVGFRCEIKDDKVGEDDNGKITVNYGSGSVAVYLDDKKPAQATLDKKVGTGVGAASAEIQNDGTIQWILKYKPAETHMSENNRGKIIIDTLPTGMTYVSGSIYPEDLNPDYSSTNNILTIDVSGLSAETTITYKTKLTDEKMEEIWRSSSRINFPNSAILSTDNNPDNKVTDSVVAIAQGTPSNHKPIGKTATKAGDKIKWTVTVNTADVRNLTSLTVKDTLGKYLVLDPATVKITPAGGTPTTKSVTPTSESNGTKVMTVELWTKTTESPNPAASYTLEYEGTIANEYYENASDPNVDNGIKNKADLLWTTTTSGNGTSTGTGIKPAGVSAKLVEKDNQGGHAILSQGMQVSYRITANPGEIVIDDYVLEDDLTITSNNVIGHSGSPYTYQKWYIGTSPDKMTADAALAEIKSRLAAASGVSAEKIIVTGKYGYDDGTTLTGFIAKFSDPITKKFRITVDTIITDPIAWAHNHSNTQIPLKNNVKATGTNGSISMSDSAYANWEFTNHMYKKVVSEYDSTNEILTWGIEINAARQFDLGTIEISDVLPTGFTYIDNSSTIEGGAGTITSQPPEGATDDLHWTISNIDAKKHILKFKTKVDINALTGDNLKTAIVATNKAGVTYGGITSDVTATVTFPAQNLTNKNVAQHIEGGVGTTKLNYSVSVNPNGIDMGSGQNLRIQDILPEGLVLDKSSVKLYYAKPGSTTPSSMSSPNTTNTNITLPSGVVKDESKPVDTSKYTISYQQNADKTSTLEVTIPEGEETKSFFLEYSAIATTYKNFVNKVNIVGDEEVENSKHDKPFNFSALAYGSAKRASIKIPDPDFFYIDIQKVDKDGNKVTTTTHNAIFGLYKDESCTDEAYSVDLDGEGEGTITLLKKSFLDVLLAEGKEYLFLKEKEAPDGGYQLSDAVTKIGIQDLINHPQRTISVQAINLKPSETPTDIGEIIIRKVDEKGEFLQNAKVTLYSDSSCADDKIVVIGGVQQKDLLIPEEGISIKKLAIGTTYYVKETTTPEGYQTAVVEPVTVQLSTVNVQLVNIPSPTDCSIEINKVDSREGKKPLKGAIFALYDITKTVKIDQKSTGEDGKVLFEGLKRETEYKLIEVSAPLGYKDPPPDLEWTIKTGTGATEADKLVTRQIENEVLKDGKVILHKVDETESLDLEGAKFAIYSDAATSETSKIDEKTTDTTGIVTFEDLSRGTKYYIKEITPPTGYVLSTDIIEVEIPLEGTAAEVAKSVTVKNEILKDGKVIIHKVDDTGTLDLEGAVFAIYSSADKTEASKIVEKTTDAEGKITFEGLTRGKTYYIEEVTPPTGYKKSEVAINPVTIPMNGTAVVVPDVVNEKEPDPKPDPKPTKPSSKPKTDQSSGEKNEDDSSTPTESSIAKTSTNTTVEQNGSGVIPQTGQLWWPVWVLGGCGILFLLFGFFWKPKKKEE